ncbi:MAG: sigma-70 family RNA polymerase sigma factor [Candidatus Diapherotrites archaeon]|nr:sigma-70 family RNA polymerase sigma factor [Candidatus Diapherotrites archaeon]
MITVEDVLQKHRNTIYNALRPYFRALAQKHAPQDLHQEATIHVLKRLRYYTPSRGSPRTFISAVVRRYALSEIKGAQRNRIIPFEGPFFDRIPIPDAGIKKLVNRDEYARMWKTAHNVLSHEELYVIRAFALGKKLQSINKARGKDRNWAGRTKNRALEKLRHALTQNRKL